MPPLRLAYGSSNGRGVGRERDPRGAWGKEGRYCWDLDRQGPSEGLHGFWRERDKVENASM